MQVTTEAVSGVTRRLNVTVPSDKLKTQFEARIKRVAKTAKINGFRPGKVPMSKIRAEYGYSVQQDVVNELIRESVFQAIQQEKINAIGVPTIESVDVNDTEMNYKAVVEVYPEFAVQGLKDLAIERKTSSVGDADVDTMIENLRKQRQQFVASDAAAANGDQVTFDFEGSIDGEKFDGGTAQDFKLVLGSNRMIPGFEDGIVGMKAGDEKTIDVTFPEDYQAKELAVKKAQFKITAKAVETAQLPEIDEEFLKVFSITAEEGVDKLKADVRRNMEREVKNGLRNQVKQAAFDALLAANPDVEVPPTLLKEEIERQRQGMLQQFAQQFGGQMPNFDNSMLPDELFREKAERSVKLGLLVGKVIDEANLSVDQDRVKALIEDMAQSYEDPAEVIDYFSNDKQQRAQVEAVTLEDQVVDHLLDNAKVTDSEVSYQDLLAAQQQARMG